MLSRSQDRTQLTQTAPRRGETKTGASHHNALKCLDLVEGIRALRDLDFIALGLDFVASGLAFVAPGLDSVAADLVFITRESAAITGPGSTRAKAYVGKAERSASRRIE
jgi:hypothetical protein